MSMITPEHADLSRQRVFDAPEYAQWLDRASRAIFRLSGQEFAERYRRGLLAGSAVADDLAAVLPLIERLTRPRS